VRPSTGHFVKTSGLRWLSLMGIVPIPWAARRWALPFLTVLVDSLRRRRKGRIGRSWYVDETYIKVQVRWCYRYRATDRHSAPGGREIQRDTRHEGGESVLSISQDGD
jgi:hypothetical protein